MNSTERSVSWLHFWLTLNEENNNKVATDDEGRTTTPANHAGTVKQAREPSHCLNQSSVLNIKKTNSISRNILILSHYTLINNESQWDALLPDADMLVTFLMYHFWFY